MMKLFGMQWMFEPSVSWASNLHGDSDASVHLTEDSVPSVLMLLPEPPTGMWRTSSNKSRLLLRARHMTRVKVVPPPNLEKGTYVLRPDPAVMELYPQLSINRALVDVTALGAQAVYLPVLNIGETHTSLPNNLRCMIAEKVEVPPGGLRIATLDPWETPEFPSIWKDLELEDKLQPKLKKKVRDLVKRHLSVFAKWPKAPPPSYVPPHVIDLLPGTRPISQRPYSESLPRREQIRKHVSTMLKGRIIRKSKSPWSAPVVLVNKPGEEKGRFCVDYRKLNEVTIPDRFPLPRVDDILSALQGSGVFSTLDLSSGFWQIPVDPEHRERTAFICSEGLFEFNRMPFGLTNSPASFQRVMNTVLAGIMHVKALVYRRYHIKG